MAVRITEQEGNRLLFIEYKLLRVIAAGDGMPPIRRGVVYFKMNPEADTKKEIDHFVDEAIDRLITMGFVENVAFETGVVQATKQGIDFINNEKREQAEHVRRVLRANVSRATINMPYEALSPVEKAAIDRQVEARLRERFEIAKSLERLDSSDDDDILGPNIPFNDPTA